ncbi:GlmU family protein [Adhaeribacter aquaticus]|uniref:GlmU family protein n=1 Tax=Adhaeribacter aquaticus TaxID=299567 RepID=UPI00040E50B2|nr:GlmU family protein [Adhaeribacter aquaticus]
MNIILFDDKTIRQNLLPLTFTRPVADIRTGILTIAEKWKHFFKDNVSYLTQDYLQAKFPSKPGTENVYVNGAICPDVALVVKIRSLEPGKALFKNKELIAFHADSYSFNKLSEFYSHTFETAGEYPSDVHFVREVWHIFQYNGQQIRSDFDFITTGLKSQPITDPYTIVYNPENIYLEEGAEVKAAILNASNGPIYLGKNAKVEEGAIIRGPFSLGEGSIVNMGGKMRGDNSIGPYCKVGGEISNSILFGYSSKGHDGFIGNSVIGEWCNLGADTNSSNMKNNYAEVKLWNYAKAGFKNTGLQFCGLVMGDHTKAGINTMFNTGTVTGVSANIFGAGLPRNFIPSFSWGGSSGFETYQLRKALETAEKAMERRGKVLTEVDKAILSKVFELEREYRTWDRKQEIHISQN